MLKYFKIWKQLSFNAAASYMSNRIEYGAFFLGKIIRFGFFILFIFSIFNYTNSLAGYDKYQVLLFFLTFNLLDVAAQAFFRGIYLLKNDVKLGNFDYILSKPVDSLFYSLSRLTDIIDLTFLIPIIGMIVWVFPLALPGFSFMDVSFYFIFFILSMEIVLALHILSAAVTVVSVENENAIWVYREAMTVGRFPPEVFSPFIQSFFTFVIPVIIICAFPVKAFLGILSLKMMALAVAVALIFLLASLMLWKKALKHYSSASS